MAMNKARLSIAILIQTISLVNAFLKKALVFTKKYA